MELDKEKRATQRVWAKKEKQLQSVLDNTANLYGDLQGLIGSAMQTIPALEAGDVVEETIVSSEIKVVVEDSDEGQAGIPF